MLVTGVLVAASHGLLDALTRGGAGIMLLWPMTEERFLAPWRLAPAAPMMLRIVSARGLEVLTREALLFAPLILYALWPPGRPFRTGTPARNAQ